jgi:hypothetical protein
MSIHCAGQTQLFKSRYLSLAPNPSNPSDRPLGALYIIIERCYFRKPKEEKGQADSFAKFTGISFIPLKKLRCYTRWENLDGYQYRLNRESSEYLTGRLRICAREWVETNEL